MSYFNEIQLFHPFLSHKQEPTQINLKLNLINYSHKTLINEKKSAQTYRNTRDKPHKIQEKHFSSEFPFRDKSADCNTHSSFLF